MDSLFGFNSRTGLRALLLACLGIAHFATTGYSQIGDRQRVVLALVEALPAPGASAVLIRQPGEDDMIVLSESAATPAMLLESLAMLRAVWGRDGLRANSEGMFRMSSRTSLSTRAGQSDRAYAIHALKILRESPIKDGIRRVGRGRSVTAQVATQVTVN